MVSWIVFDQKIVVRPITALDTMRLHIYGNNLSEEIIDLPGLVLESFHHPPLIFGAVILRWPACRDAELLESKVDTCIDVLKSRDDFRTMYEINCHSHVVQEINPVGS